MEVRCRNFHGSRSVYSLFTHSAVESKDFSFLYPGEERIRPQASSTLEIGISPVFFFRVYPGQTPPKLNTLGFLEISNAFFDDFRGGIREKIPGIKWIFHRGTSKNGVFSWTFFEWLVASTQEKYTLERFSRKELENRTLWESKNLTLCEKKNTESHARHSRYGTGRRIGD